MVYDLTPVNKQASIVTSQSGCSDNFFLDLEEKRKVLVERYNQSIAIKNNLENKIGIKPSGKGAASTRYPRHIMRHKDFNLYLDIKQICCDTQKEIAEINAEIKKQRPDFYKNFILAMREEYPEIFEKVRAKILAAAPKKGE